MRIAVVACLLVLAGPALAQPVSVVERRDLALATRYACGHGPWSDEWYPRVLDLVRKAGTHWAEQDFSWCDDADTTPEDDVCAGHERRMGVAARAVEFDVLTARLHGPAAARFAELRLAQAAWRRARAREELDQSGSGRVEFDIDEEEQQDRDLLDMVSLLAAGYRPPLGHAELRAANIRMHAELRRIAAVPLADTAHMGIVTPASVASVQARWHHYRNAWAAFAATAYPAWGVVAVEAWLTQDRADMLADLLRP